MTLDTAHQPIHVDLGDLSGPGGNAYAVLGRAFEALRAAGADQARIDAFKTEATSSDYEHLLATVDALRAGRV